MKMMIKDLGLHVGESACLSGWVANIRSSGSLVFITLRDGGGFVQCIVSKDSVSCDVWSSAVGLGLESSVIIDGIVAKHPKKSNEFELHVSGLQILQAVSDYPIAKKDHGPKFLLDNRHLWLRSSRQWAIQRVRNTVINAIYEFFARNAFIKIDSPILTPNACEGTTELFEIDYFDDKKAYLSQSGQLYLESAIMAHGRVFDFGPVFRAEKSKTRRHLIEFWMMDAEMAFFEHQDNMRLQEEMVVYIVEKVLAENRPELEILERNISALEKVKAPFIRKTHAEVVAELHSMGSAITEMSDLGADDETMLTNKYDRPIFVEKYPLAVKAFYMKPDPNDKSRALCADLLAPEGYGEIIGGSQREDDYDALLLAIKNHGLNPDVFSWYLDLRKYGSVPHSGFGIGLERTVAWICGITHVRETIPFPRLLNRLNP